MRTSTLPDGRVVVCAQDVDPDKLVGMVMFVAEGQEQYEPEWTGLNEHGEPVEIEEGVICSATERHDRELEGPDIDITYMTTLALRANAMFGWVLKSELDSKADQAKRASEHADGPSFRVIYQLKCHGLSKYFSGKSTIFSRIVYTDRDIAEGAKAGFRERCVSDDGMKETEVFATLEDHPETVVTVVELELFQ